MPSSRFQKAAQLAARSNTWNTNDVAEAINEQLHEERDKQIGTGFGNLLDAWDNEEYFDKDLKTGIGRVCKACKAKVVAKKNKRKKVRRDEEKAGGARVYLDCPYSEKDACKELGGRWDRFSKSWYIFETQDASLFKEWM